MTSSPATGEECRLGDGSPSCGCPVSVQERCTCAPPTIVLKITTHVCTHTDINETFYFHLDVDSLILQTHQNIYYCCPDSTPCSDYWPALKFSNITVLITVVARCKSGNKAQFRLKIHQY